MAQPPLPESVLRETLDLVREHGGVSAAAIAAGLPRGTFESRYQRARVWAEAQAAPPEKPFAAPVLPEDVPTADELIARRRKQFERKSAAHDARALVPVRVTVDGPFGLALMGDPHVDDDGTDIALLERHVAIINRTEGLLAGNIGDYSNNWVGRLARLYGEQSLSAQEAWVLVEWLVRSVHWLFLIGGNHDCFNDARGTLIKVWINKCRKMWARSSRI